MFKISTKSLPPIGTNVIVIANDETKQLWVFDAPAQTKEHLAAHYAGYTVEGLFYTHGHYDHMLGGHAVAALRTFAHEGDTEMLLNPETMAAWLDEGDGPLVPVKIDQWLKGGEVLTVAGLTLEVRHTPGHSRGCVIFYIPALKVAVAGDTIFQEGIGRTDLPGGSFEDIERSIRTHIYTLPDATVLYPGHGGKTTVAHEKENNPFVRP